MWRCKFCGNEVLERNRIKYCFEVSLKIPENMNTKNDLDYALSIIEKQSKMPKVYEKEIYCRCGRSTKPENISEIAEWKNEGMWEIND